MKVSGREIRRHIFMEGRLKNALDYDPKPALWNFSAPDQSKHCYAINLEFIFKFHIYCLIFCCTNQVTVGKQHTRHMTSYVSCLRSQWKVWNLTQIYDCYHRNCFLFIPPPAPDQLQRFFWGLPHNIIMLSSPFQVFPTSALDSPTPFPKWG